MVAFLKTQSHYDEKGNDALYSYRVRASHAQLFGIDRTEWDGFDAKIAAAADKAMISVDAETVRLFTKYNVEMPAEFAKDTRWKGRAPAAAHFTELSQDRVQEAKLRANQSVKDRAEVNAAILATDARRKGLVPPDWYKLRSPKASSTT